MKKKLALLAALIIIIAAAVLLLPRFFAEKHPITAQENEYTIAMLSDTQFYSRSLPDYFEKMTQFLADERDALKLAYVVHTGDIVNSPYEQEQWQNADKAMRLLGDIPHGVLPGNHDTGNGEDRYADFKTYFGEERFAGCSWYGGAHEGNRGHFDLVTMGGTDFVVVFLSDDPAKCCVEFANETFAAYPDRIGILCLHKYLSPEGKLNDMGEYLQAKIVAANDNVRLVLCGHESTTNYLTSTVKNSDGSERTVLQIIANYQDNANNGGNGYMLLITVNEEAGTLNAVTYSPVTEEYIGHEDELSVDEFTVALPW